MTRISARGCIVLDEDDNVISAALVLRQCVIPHIGNADAHQIDRYWYARVSPSNASHLGDSCAGK
jgi:hypothetical protein